ncbi:MAG: hypothetical protein LBV12_07155 [Puniceicoccales bacterium]|nr:hypothetical protein [Puniceicoccales bacterium]
MKNNSIRFPLNPWDRAAREAGDDVQVLKDLVYFLINEHKRLERAIDAAGFQCPARIKPPKKKVISPNPVSLVPIQLTLRVGSREIDLRV